MILVNSYILNSHKGGGFEQSRLTTLFASDQPHISFVSDQPRFLQLSIMPKPVHDTKASFHNRQSQRQRGVELKKTAEDEAFIDDAPELKHKSRAAELEAERCKTEMACETSKNKCNNGGGITLKQKLEEARAQCKLMDDGHFDNCLCCPICSMQVAESTNNDGETNTWCPNRCPLSWKPNHQKAAFLGELPVRLLKELVNPNSPFTCTHKETCKLLHLIGERIKNPDLQDTLFLPRSVQNARGG